MTVATRRKAKSIETHRNDPPALTCVETFGYLGFACKYGRDRETRDWLMEVDGQPIGYAVSGSAADTTIREHCGAVLAHTRATTADMAAERAENKTLGTCEHCHAGPATHQVGGRSAAALWLCDACGELAAQGLRLADEDEAGWWVRMNNGTKVWATDDTPCPCEGDGMCSVCDTEREVTSYDDDATPEQIAQRDAENEAAMLEWLHESDATAPQAPTRTVSELQEELERVTDAIHDRKAVGAGYARLHQQRSRIIAELDAAHTVEDAALRQRLWEIITPDAPPYVSLGDDPEGTTRPPRCDGYQGSDCLNRAVITREVNLSTNPADPYDVRTFHLCDLCSDAWSAWLPTKPCLACGGAHHIQRCAAVHAPRPSLALWGPPNPLCPKCQQTHDPILDCQNPVAVPSDPCAALRQALTHLVAALQNDELLHALVEHILNYPAEPAAPLFESIFQVELEAARAALGE